MMHNWKNYKRGKQKEIDIRRWKLQRDYVKFNIAYIYIIYI